MKIQQTNLFMPKIKGINDFNSLKKTQDISTSNSMKMEQSPKSIVDSTFSYSESIRESRQKSKDTSLQVKKLKYNYKSISTKLLRSKTSQSAKMVANEARREVIKLKRQRQNGSEDDEELQNAIAHAQAMERVAKKRARHLLQEEMAEASSSGAILFEDEELENAENEELEGTKDEDLESMEAEALDDEYVEDEFYAEELDFSDMTDEMWEAMKELLEEAGLEELTEEFGATTVEDLDPEDLKMMKIKHRNSEMKDIVKADSDYLKQMFEKLSPNVPSTQAGIPQASIPQVGIQQTVPLQVEGAAVDISL